MRPPDLAETGRKLTETRAMKPLRELAESDKRLPGTALIHWRESPVVWAPVAWLASLAWPPIIITLLAWPPQAFSLGLDMDWRLLGLIWVAVGTAIGLWLLRREWRRSRTPTTRLGVIWRFTLFGAVLAVGAQLLLVFILLIGGWLRVTGPAQGLGVAETTFFIYGVGLLPITALVGAAFASWAGLMVSLIAFTRVPEPMRTPYHILKGQQQDSVGDAS
ncbi:hypothetical protein [Brevundimonas aveniformis]|uniref:hypothetical protein n=1 Tax=Brevundimonas aveniformis TaxID=370977 RepID=UPI0003F5D374|nr:hypothetical protein [Brevundimonas aveniformis]